MNGWCTRLTIKGYCLILLSQYHLQLKHVSSFFNILTHTLYYTNSLSHNYHHEYDHHNHHHDHHHHHPHHQPPPPPSTILVITIGTTEPIPTLPTYLTPLTLPISPTPPTSIVITTHTINTTVPTIHIPQVFFFCCPVVKVSCVVLTHHTDGQDQHG